jgi:hypothetical protein
VQAADSDPVDPAGVDHGRQYRAWVSRGFIFFCIFVSVAFGPTTTFLAFCFNSIFNKHGEQECAA